MDENELAMLLVRLSKALAEQKVAQEILAEANKDVAFLKDKIDKAHPMFFNLFDRPNGKIRHIAHHKVNRQLWAPQIIEWAKKQPTPVTSLQLSRHFNIPMNLAASRLRALARAGSVKLIQLPAGIKAYAIVVRG